MENVLQKENDELKNQISELNGVLSEAQKNLNS